MFKPEQFLRRARDETGLSDYGDDNFMEGLQCLTSSLNREANLNDVGRYAAGVTISNSLKTRLQLEDYIRANPELLDREVERPVFIVGLPRTGTTALHHLLNQDKRNHTLRLWEGRRPVPPPEDATYTSDLRIQKESEGVSLTEKMIPGFSAAHLMGAEEPDECYMLFNRLFQSVEFTAMYHIPTYMHWLFQMDLDDAYAYHKRQLQVLQHKKSGRMILKSPFHQLGLESILKHYPDALIVQQHRAPETIVASGCSFSEILKRPFSDSVDPLDIGREWLFQLETYTNTFETARASLEQLYPQQFIDIHYEEFVRDPWPAMEKIYAHIPQEMSADARASIQHWIDSNPKGKRGSHEYRLEQYGLDSSDVERVFGEYKHKYGL